MIRIDRVDVWKYGRANDGQCPPKKKGEEIPKFRVRNRRYTP